MVTECALQVNWWTIPGVNGIIDTFSRGSKRSRSLALLNQGRYGLKVGLRTKLTCPNVFITNRKETLYNKLNYVKFDLGPKSNQTFLSTLQFGVQIRHDI